MSRSSSSSSSRAIRCCAQYRGCCRPFFGFLDVVNVDLLAASTTRLLAAVRVTILVKLKGAVAVLTAAKGVGLVDLGCLGQLAVGFERTGLVGGVLEAVYGGKRPRMSAHSRHIVYRERGEAGRRGGRRRRERERKETIRTSRHPCRLGNHAAIAG